MAGPIEATGAARNPTRYGTLTQAGREITGMWTNRNPLRDAAVPYLVGKFYGGSRFDSIIDGINREISVRMTDPRSPGSIVFNNNIFPACNSFYPWKYIQGGAEIVRTIYDGKDGTIYDATPGQKSSLFVKGAGAGPARFLGVNTELFFGDGVETMKILRSSRVWSAGMSVTPGNFIIDSNGNIQSCQANPVSYTINQVRVVQTDDAAYKFYLVVRLTATAPQIPANQTASFSGLTNFLALNGRTIQWQGSSARALAVIQPTANEIIFGGQAVAVYGPAADTGTMVAMTDLPANTAGVQPVWPTAWGATILDGGVMWTCFGPASQNWGVSRIPAQQPAYPQPGTPDPTLGPQVFPTPGRADFPTASPVTCWFPKIQLIAALFPGPVPLAILDDNANIQIAQLDNSSIGGIQLPQWATQIGAQTLDGNISWINYGPAGTWYAGNDYGGGTLAAANSCVILDPNGNLQYTDNLTTAQISSAGPLTWATAIGTTTADGPITWTCAGPGNTLWSGIYEYAWSPHCIDGSVGTASPLSLVANGGLGPSGGFQNQLLINIIGTAARVDPQVDQLWIWRTAQGQATPVLLDIIPNPWLLAQNLVTYQDVSRDLDLNAQIPAPIASEADPPDPTMTAPVYHLQRPWAIVGNNVVYGGGPDTITGNGNTTFPPLNFIPYPCQPIRLIPVTVQNGGILVLTTDGVYIILGTGTPSNPFYTTLYYSTVSITGYTAVDVYNNQVFLMEANGRVSSLAIEYPFNPQTGYTEVGFPIGDQFKKVTTGGVNGKLYTPATAYLSWNVQSTDENAMYVADGAIGWFRMGIIMPPETGMVWSPRRAIEGGTSAVQSIETSPGLCQLLIAPKAGTTGPILARDDSGTVFSDNGAPYPAWDARGVILMCASGQWVDIAHIATKSRAVGARPTISVLLNELLASAKRPWQPLALVMKSNDPAISRENLSLYSDRYSAQQNGAPIQGDAISVKFDYGTQDAGDELMDWGIFTSLHDERVEEAAKV